jgi:hypothetical protein
MKYGSWAPVIQSFLYNGKTVPTISVRRLSSIGGELKKIVQETNFEICFVKTYDQEGDVIRFTFCYQSIEDKHFYYVHKDGANQGTSAVKYNAVNVTSEYKSG